MGSIGSLILYQRVTKLMKFERWLLKNFGQMTDMQPEGFISNC